MNRLGAASKPATVHEPAAAPPPVPIPPPPPQWPPSPPFSPSSPPPHFRRRGLPVPPSLAPPPSSTLAAAAPPPAPPPPQPPLPIPPPPPPPASHLSRRRRLLLHRRRALQLAGECAPAAPWATPSDLAAHAVGRCCQGVYHRRIHPTLPAEGPGGRRRARRLGQWAARSVPASSRLTERASIACQQQDGRDEQGELPITVIGRLVSRQ